MVDGSVRVGVGASLHLVMVSSGVCTSMDVCGGRKHLPPLSSAAGCRACIACSLCIPAADEGRGCCRNEQRRCEQQLAAARVQLDKAEAALSEVRAEGVREREAGQARLHAAESTAAAAQLELERERLQRRACEGEAGAVAREEAAAASRALQVARSDAERLEGALARLQVEKGELEDALRGARTDLLAAHTQLAKATEELAADVSKVCSQPHACPMASRTGLGFMATGRACCPPLPHPTAARSTRLPFNLQAHWRPACFGSVADLRAAAHMALRA